MILERVPEQRVVSIFSLSGMPSVIKTRKCIQCGEKRSEREMRRVPTNDYVNRLWLNRLAFDEDHRQGMAHLCSVNAVNHICDLHFEDESFVDNERRVLRMGALPRNHVSFITTL